MSCKTSDMSRKEVVSVSDCRRLGCICDFEIDTCDGRIIGVYLPGECGLFGFGFKDRIYVPWCNITKIGEDIIIVDLPPRPCKNDKCDSCETKRRFRFW